ncbi:MAG: calcium-binding protein [Candidatus Poribacteria bacterium]
MKKRKLSDDELDEMISEATVDCYDEEEAFMGVLYTIQGNLSFPFKAKALGDTVEVIDIDDEKSSRGRGIIAKVRKQGKEFNIGLAELEIESGSENDKWLEMYHYWLEKY